MADYKIQARDKSGNILGEFKDFAELRYSKRLNNYGELHFRTPVKTAGLSELIAPRVYEIYLYRGNVLIWSGEQVMYRVELATDNVGWLELTCYDWFEQLSARYTDEFVRYDATDAGEIAWGLIDTSQTETNGDFGFTEGIIEATVDRDRTYENKNIADAIIQLSEVNNGFDFEITNNKVFNVYDHKGSDKSGSIVFEYGTNMDSVSVINNFTEPVNQAIVLGAGFGSSQLRAVRTDSSSGSSIKLRQSVVSYIDVSETATANAKGDEILRTKKQSLLTLTFQAIPGRQPVIGSAVLGDTVKIKVSEGLLNINNNFRVYGYDVFLSNDGAEYVKYLVALI